MVGNLNSDMWETGKRAFKLHQNCTIAPKLLTAITLAIANFPGTTSECVKIDSSKALVFNVPIATPPKSLNPITRTNESTLKILSKLRTYFLATSDILIYAV